MTTTDESMPAQPAQVSNTTLDTPTINTLLLKAGSEAPTGAKIVGVMELTLAAAGECWIEHMICTGGLGSPVFADADGLTWAIDDQGRWQPVEVSLVPPKVDWLCGDAA